MKLFAKPISNETLALLNSADKRSFGRFRSLRSNVKSEEVARGALERIIEINRAVGGDKAKMAAELKALAKKITPNHTVWNRFVGKFTLRERDIYYDLELLRYYIKPELLEKQVAELKN